jgi:hypothetical protein
MYKKNAMVHGCSWSTYRMEMFNRYVSLRGIDFVRKIYNDDGKTVIRMGHLSTFCLATTESQNGFRLEVPLGNRSENAVGQKPQQMKYKR